MKDGFECTKIKKKNSQPQHRSFDNQEKDHIFSLLTHFHSCSPEHITDVRNLLLIVVLLNFCESKLSYFVSFVELKDFA